MCRLVLVLMLVAAGCGGRRSPEASQPIGTTHVPPADAAPDALKVAPMDAGRTDFVSPPPPVAPEASVTIELANEGTGDLVFAVDKGWQPVLFAYSGKPPKAKSVVLFPMACTASCDAAGDERCPVCLREADPAKAKEQEREETRREVAPAGGVVAVPWDGKVLEYEKASGAKRKCKCWRKAEPEPGEYTFKACGLRPSTVAGTPSKPVCAEAQVKLPLEATQGTIRLGFAK